MKPTWWIVFTRELRDLWVGGKALYLILMYALLLGVYAFVLASNAEVKLLPTREMVVEMVKVSIVVGLFICLIIGADSFSGERDRATLEGLLLSPASRSQVALGKLLAATSPWPVALALAIPYWILLADSPTMLGQALVWGSLLGTLLAPAIAAMGMLVSVWCNSNRTSMLVSLCLFLVLLLPTELMGGPAKIQRTAEQWARAEISVLINPVAAPLRFLWKTMANGLPAADLWYWHTVPLLFTIGILVFLFAYAGPRVRLEPQMARKVRSFWDRLRPARKPAAPAARPAVAAVAATFAEVARVPEPRVQLRRTSDKARVSVPPSPAGPVSGTWWLVFKKELRDLWIGGKALYMCLILTVVLGGYSYIMARDSVLSLIPPPEMVYEMLKAAMVGAVFVALIIGADSLSGERERATLEGLLLTPTSRRQIVLGKFLAAVSPGPVALAIALPYMKLLSQGDPVFWPAVFWGAAWGALLVPAYTALGMFVGFWCNSNRTSLFVSLCLYLLFLLPTQLPGRAQGGFMGTLAQWVNPMAAERVFLSKILTNNQHLTSTYGVGPLWTWGLSTIVFTVVIFGLLFWYAGPGLRLEGGRRIRLLSAEARAAAVALLVALLAFGAAPTMVLAQEPAAAMPTQVAAPTVDVAIDLGATTVRAGTPVLYKTVLTNTGAAAIPSVIVAMNIINLNAKGEIVDPEDWSPQRTQYTESIAPGQSVTLDWRVNAILDGDYMVYMVVVPPPTSPETTSHPVTSPGIHLTVTPFTRLNPGGVMPFAIGGPLVLALVIFFVYRHRRKQIDAGGSA